MKHTESELFPRVTSDGPNTFWPLPADYPLLTRDGRRLARVNACLLQQTPELATHAWNFFCLYYLRPHHDYDPMFYEDYLPPAAIHHHMVLWFEKYPLTAMAFPRGGGKSTNVRSYVLFKLITNWQFLSSMYLSKFKPFVPRTMEIFKRQLTENRRIVEDFGELAPRRGKGVWTAEIIRLTNGSEVSLWAADGALRGIRGHFAAIDDIEKDPEEQYPSAERIEKVKSKVTKQIFGTLKPGSSAALLGTLFHQMCLLNHVLTCDDEDSPDYDKQFLSVDAGGYWMKANLGSVYDKNGNIVWKGMWTEAFLCQQRQTMGFSGFSSEFGGEAVSVQKPLFKVEPDQHEYFLEDVDEFAVEEPFRSRAVVRWHQCTGDRNVVCTPCQQLWADKINSMIRGIVVDVARGLSASHDFSVIVVVGMDEFNDMWILDVWQDRVSDAMLIWEIWKYAMRWQCSVVGIEAIGLQEQYFHAAQAKSHQMMEKLGYVPQMLPITHGAINKGIRIKRLEWRFNWGKIKYPGWRSREYPIDQLYNQTLRFTEDLANLKHDDVIDTVEMAQTIFRGQKGVAPQTVAPQTVEERLLAGEQVYEGTDIPLASGINIHDLSPEMLEGILKMRREEQLQELAGDDSEDVHEWVYDDAF